MLIKRGVHDRGTALVELSVALPLMMIMLVGTIDFGRVFYRALAVGQAARAGAEYGAQSLAKSTDTTAIKAAAKNAVSSDLTLIDSDLSTARTCQCATNAGVFSNTSPANTCTGTPCTAPDHLVISVGVTASKAFSVPYLGMSSTITRTTKIRVR
jgi:Flp pilus assembly protein TadG